MTFNRITCTHCGNDEFRKSSTISCSAVPPFFRCTKCDRFLLPKYGILLNPSNKLDSSKPFPINTADDHFIGHLKCFVCGETAEGELPERWELEEKILYDPDGNPMTRTYAYCPEHRR